MLRFVQNNMKLISFPHGQQRKLIKRSFHDPVEADLMSYSSKEYRFIWSLTILFQCSHFSSSDSNIAQDAFRCSIRLHACYLKKRPKLLNRPKTLSTYNIRPVMLGLWGPLFTVAYWVELRVYWSKWASPGPWLNHWWDLFIERLDPEKVYRHLTKKKKRGVIGGLEEKNAVWVATDLFTEEQLITVIYQDRAWHAKSAVELFRLLSVTLVTDDGFQVIYSPYPLWSFTS